MPQDGGKRRFTRDVAQVAVHAVIGGAEEFHEVALDMREGMVLADPQQFVRFARVVQLAERCGELAQRLLPTDLLPFRAAPGLRSGFVHLSGLRSRSGS